MSGNSGDEDLGNDRLPNGKVKAIHEILARCDERSRDPGKCANGIFLGTTELAGKLPGSCRSVRRVDNPSPRLLRLDTIRACPTRPPSEN